MFKVLATLLLLLLGLPNSSSDKMQDKISEIIRKDYPNIEMGIDDKGKYETSDVSKNLSTESKKLKEEAKYFTTEKIETYNIHSDKMVGQVAQVAVEKSGALIPCNEVEGGCEDKKDTPTPTKTPTPTVTPTPTLTPTPTPIITIIPEPSLPPCPPPPCGYNKDSRFYLEMPCPMYPEVYPCPYLL